MSDFLIMKKLLSFILAILLVNITYGATLYGSIYDSTLSKTKDVLIIIDSNPSQKFLSKDGSYEFEIPIGDYKLSAQKNELKAIENISIIDEGIYVIDLFLFQDLSEEESIYNNLDLEIEGLDDREIKYLNLFFLIIFLMGVFSFIIIQINKKIQTIRLKKHLNLMDDDLNKIIQLLKKNQGRMSQRELRKHFALSEAKISLMITELETEGKLRKIKKGRGNILILEKFK